MYKLQWNKIGVVAPQEGYEKNIGTAGLLKGVIDNKLIFGGGANFPGGLPVDGGTKVTHKDIYLYEIKDNEHVLLDQIQYDYPLAYGPSANYKDKIYYIANKDESSSDILELTIKNNKININVIGTLPLTVENTVAEVYNNKLYFGIGSINGKNTKELYSYDLETKTFEVETEFPGELRSQALSYVYNDSLIVYGGGAAETYSDGYKYVFKEKTWTKLADVIVDNYEYSLLGADWCKLNEDELLVIGGFDKDVWKDAVFKLSTLTGEEHTKYRDAYFRRPVEDFKWNKHELVYNLNNNTWTKLDEINFEAPCGHALLSTDAHIYSIMGEIKPAVRSPYIHQAKK